MGAFKADAYLKTAAAERITHTILVPAMYNLCLLRPDFASHDLSAWRVGVYGGAPMPQATIEALAVALPGLYLSNAYGSTETTSPTTLLPMGEAVDRSDTVGRAVHCARVLVVDDQGCEVPPGEEGEIWISGPMVVKGYWGKAEATAENFVAGHWTSGDIGSLDAEGYLRVFDRKEDMINRGGYKIYSIEVENVLAYHDAVVEAAIVPKPCPVLGERVHCFLVPKEGAVDTAEIQRFCAERLSDYKVPESFTLRTEPLPRNANGKVLKRALVDLLPTD
jgi:acyl-CoA synthetase (AMP-forming)/AMP-acid ligase II